MFRVYKRCTMRYLVMHQRSASFPCYYYCNSVSSLLGALCLLTFSRYIKYILSNRQYRTVYNTGKEAMFFVFFPILTLNNEQHVSLEVITFMKTKLLYFRAPDQYFLPSNIFFLTVFIL